MPPVNPRAVSLTPQLITMPSDFTTPLSPSMLKKGGKTIDAAALQVQKVYRSYRTRRQLADSAVVVEELWWQALDFTRLNYSTISFFSYCKSETAPHKLARVGGNASRVGKGLSKDAKAMKLALQHWLEVVDPRHRYGHNLSYYYEEWRKSNFGQPFFYWLNVGEGRTVDLEACRRHILQNQCIKYLGPFEREHYEYEPKDGKIVHVETGEFLDTTKCLPSEKWIFVMSVHNKLYAGPKKKGQFHHSSFLAGGTTLADGRLTAQNGVLKAVSAHSGHYCTTEENLGIFLSFLQNNGINLEEVEIRSTSEDESSEESKRFEFEKISKIIGEVESFNLEDFHDPPLERPRKELPLSTAAFPIQDDHPQESANGQYRRTLSGGLQSPRTEVPKNAILQRIDSKSRAGSYQLGRQVTLKWCSGAGPRIGCIADYPPELKIQALELVNLSPRLSTPSQCCTPPSSCLHSELCNAVTG